MSSSTEEKNVDLIPTKKGWEVESPHQASLSQYKIRVTSSDTYQNQIEWHPKNLFNGSSDDGWHTNFVKYKAFLIIQFFTSVIANSIVMLPRPNCLLRAPTSFKILGSEDSFVYEELGTFDDIYWDAFEEKIFTFKNEKAYNYYKIIFIAIPDNYLSLFSLNLRRLED